MAPYKDASSQRFASPLRRWQAFPCLAWRMPSSSMILSPAKARTTQPAARRFTWKAFWNSGRIGPTRSGCSKHSIAIGTAMRSGLWNGRICFLDLRLTSSSSSIVQAKFPRWQALSPTASMIHAPSFPGSWNLPRPTSSFSSRRGW